MRCPRHHEMRAFFSCLTWRAIPSPLSKLKRRLDTLESTQWAPRDPCCDLRGKWSPLLPLEARPDSPRAASGYWYVSTTDTVSFLGVGGKGRVGDVSRTPAPCSSRPLPSPVDEQVHFLILVPTQGLTAHEVVLVPGHAAEIRAGPGVKASLRDLGSGPGLPTLGPARRTC